MALGLRYEIQLINYNGCVWVWVWVQTLVSCPPGGWSHLLLHFKHRPKVKKKKKRKANDPWYFFSDVKILFSRYLQIVHHDTLWEASWILKWWTCRKFWTLRKSRTFRSGWKLPLLWSGVQEEWPFYMVPYYYEVADKKEPSPENNPSFAIVQFF